MNKATEKYLQKFIRQITTAAANISLYHQEHPQVLLLCRQALGQLQLLFNETPDLSLKIIEQKLIYNNQPVPGNQSVERLVDALGSRGVEHLELSPGLCSEELLNLAKNLSKHPGEEKIPRKTEHIQYGRIEVRKKKSVSGSRENTSMTDFSEIAEQGLDKFMDTYLNAGRKKQLNVVGIAEIVNDFVNAFSSHGEVLLAIAPLRSMDEYAYVHSTNICLLNLAQAKLLGIDGQRLNDIGIAAMLHDVGKMFISPEILNKPEKLNEEEWRIMQQHPQLGAEYLLNSPGVPRLAIITAYEHHIGYDGRGYPKTPHNRQLNTCSYMTSISDVYDALRTRRSYKEPLSMEQISVIMLESAGKSLHPELTRSFLDAVAREDTCV